ncbi:flagellar hook-basal body protein [Salibacterium salarium]|uniref:Flagellar hook-basal body protein n=1 Tax=Salibacterium salarium TaxID=284579 RepID=A0A428MRV1_9BACI|nr:flagellar hook-basal body protein [Salibacterium salarium]RSL28871.1 flagellar hook-basal body protein [Salibacterium salarium]
MDSSVLASANTMGQLQTKLNGISNNLANSDTTGYKRRETTFSDMLFQQVNNHSEPRDQSGRLTPDGLRVGTGASIAQTALRLEQGALQETGRELDFAITEKDNFFQVESMTDGEAETQYTRDGSFYLSENPEEADGWALVNNQGDYLLDEDGGRMEVPAGASDFSLQEDGTLQATLDDGEEVDVGEMGMVRVTKPQLLEGTQGNNFRLPDLDELDLEEADVLEFVPGEENQLTQGSLEQSNVDMGQAMTDMTRTQRSYSFNARAVSQGDQMMGLVNSIRG